MTYSRALALFTGVAASALLVAGCAPVSITQNDSPGTTPAGTPSTQTSQPAAPATEGSQPVPSTTAPEPTQPSPSLTGAPRTVTINYSGDLLWHNTLWTTAELDARAKGAKGMDFEPQLAALKAYVSKADMAICHSEVPFSPVGGPYKNYPMFQAPPPIADALPKIGWDVCTTASNHSLDAGFSGLVRTIEMHRAAGILTAGTYESEEASRTPVIFTTANGVKVGVVSTTFGTNGIPIPKGKKWSVQLMDIEETLAAAKRARQAGANIVVVHMHAGTEYASKPNSQQTAFAEAMTASPDVDLLVGQHAHVVQPITRVNNKWVAYGSGNLIAQSGPAKPRTYDGYLATFSFTEQPDGSFTSTAGEFAPTFITKGNKTTPVRVYIVSDALAAGQGNKSALTASAERTRKTVLSLGAEGLTEH